MEWIKPLVELVTSLGALRGTMVVFFFGMHLAVWLLYKGRLDDRQSEINRLAQENKEHRERFTVLMDKKLNIPKGRLPRQIKPPKRK